MRQTKHFTDSTKFPLTVHGPVLNSLPGGVWPFRTRSCVLLTCTLPWHSSTEYMWARLQASKKKAPQPASMLKFKITINWPLSQNICCLTDVQSCFHTSDWSRTWPYIIGCLVAAISFVNLNFREILHPLVSFLFKHTTYNMYTKYQNAKLS